MFIGLEDIPDVVECLTAEDIGMYVIILALSQCIIDLIRMTNTYISLSTD